MLKAFSWRLGAWELALGPCKGSQPLLHLSRGSPLLQAGHNPALPTSWSLEKPPGYDVGEGSCALQDVVTPPAWWLGEVLSLNICCGDKQRQGHFQALKQHTCPIFPLGDLPQSTSLWEGNKQKKKSDIPSLKHLDAME